MAQVLVRDPDPEVIERLKKASTMVRRDEMAEMDARDAMTIFLSIDIKVRDAKYLIYTP